MLVIVPAILSQSEQLVAMAPMWLSTGPLLAPIVAVCWPCCRCKPCPLWSLTRCRWTPSLECMTRPRSWYGNCLEKEWLVSGLAPVDELTPCVGPGRSALHYSRRTPTQIDGEFVASSGEVLWSGTRTHLELARCRSGETPNGRCKRIMPGTLGRVRNGRRSASGEIGRLATHSPCVQARAGP